MQVKIAKTSSCISWVTYTSCFSSLYTSIAVNSLGPTTKRELKCVIGFGVSSDDGEKSSKKLRSGAMKFNWKEMCFFCGESVSLDTKDSKLNLLLINKYATQRHIYVYIYWIYQVYISRHFLDIMNRPMYYILIIDTPISDFFRHTQNNSPTTPAEYNQQI